MKYLIRFCNGYCGCDEEEEFEGTYSEAKSFANDYLEYYENCYYEIEEVEQEEEE